MINHYKNWLMVAVFALISACSPIDDYSESLSSVEKKLANGHYVKQIEKTKQIIVKLSESPAYQSALNDELLEAEKKLFIKKVNAIAAYAKKLRSMEDWEDNARNRGAARQVFDQLSLAISQLNSELRQWVKLYNRVEDIIVKTSEEKSKVEQSAAAFRKAASDTHSKIVSAKATYPHQAARLNSFASHLNDFDEKYTTLLNFVQGKVNTPKINDYLAYVALYDSVDVNNNFPLTLANDYARMVKQLYSSYSKVLLEAEEYHGVALGAVSWDNYYDHPTEHSRTFPYTEVSYSQLQKIKQHIGSGTTKYVSSIKSDSIIAMATSGKSKDGWDSGDDEAEIWLEDAESEHTHLYLIIDNGVATEVEESVDRATYLRLANAIDKEVLTKPYGKFEDEAVDVPHNPGMAFVGHPQYGQWERNPTTGADVWVWFAAYSIMSDLTKDRIDRRRHERYLASMHGYIPPSSRGNYRGTNRYGVTSHQSPIQSSLTRSRNSNLKGSGQSFRNRGPSSGK